MLPLTAGFLIAGPISGTLSDRYGPRPFATAGLMLAAVCFCGLMLLPVNFSFWLFALLIFGNGVGSGLFASPNTAAIMSAVPGEAPGFGIGHAIHLPELRHVAVHRHLLSLMIAGAASTPPRT